MPEVMDGEFALVEGVVRVSSSPEVTLDRLATLHLHRPAWVSVSARCHRRIASVHPQPLLEA
jgi:hypothetical protein